MSVEAARVEWMEVGPRDGLQSLADFVPTERKLRFVEDLVDAGCRAIEVTSFVSPRAIPQMRDADELCRRLPRREGVFYGAFVPNRAGLDRAVAAGIDGVGVAIGATDAFNERNVGATIEQSLARVREISAGAESCGLPVRGYVACAVDCPVTGPVEPGRVLSVAEALLDAGCGAISLGDTTGRGTPASLRRLLDAVLPRIPAERVGGHFHDTWGQALANVAASLDHGIRQFDSAVAGLGGCPAAAGAAGNLPTEDLLYLLDDLGVDTGADLERIAAIGAGLCNDLGIRVDSKAGRAQVERSRRERENAS